MIQKQKFTMPKQISFILFGEALDQVNRGGSIGLSLGYNDNADALGQGAGKYVEYIQGTDKYGKPKGKRFKFDESFRKLMTRPDEHSDNKISQYEFLKNRPECEDSPNGQYVMKGGKRVQLGVVYREYNPQKDAETALAADKLRIEAGATALGLDDQTLEEVANILGHYINAENKLENELKALRVRVIDFAQKKPSEFNELLESGDRALRALVRKAINEGEFTMKGSLIMWENFMVGGSEDDAINTLMRDPKMVDALKEKLKLNVPTEAIKSKGGRPRKTDGAPVEPVANPL